MWIEWPHGNLHVHLRLFQLHLPFSPGREPRGSSGGPSARHRGSNLNSSTSSNLFNRRQYKTSCLPPSSTRPAKSLHPLAFLSCQRQQSALMRFTCLYPSHPLSRTSAATWCPSASGLGLKTHYSDWPNLLLAPKNQHRWGAPAMRHRIHKT